MKNYFIKSMISNSNNVDIEKTIYGLDVIYISFTKLLFILFASIIFNCFYITLACVILISFIRCFSYGLHMESSIKCYIFSLLIFVIIPRFFINIDISNIQVFISFLLGFLSFILYAPADTNKRPIINKKKRKTLKFLSLSMLTIYTLSYYFLKDSTLSKIVLYSIIIQSIILNPITYKLFNLPYDNFKEVMK